jgi:hypothetical protein
MPSLVRGIRENKAFIQQAHESVIEIKRFVSQKVAPACGADPKRRRYVAPAMIAKASRADDFVTGNAQKWSIIST